MFWKEHLEDGWKIADLTLPNIFGAQKRVNLDFYFQTL